MAFSERSVTAWWSPEVQSLRGCRAILMALLAGCTAGRERDGVAEQPDAGSIERGDAGAGASTMELELFHVADGTPAGDTLFAGGTFNDWKADDARFAFVPGPRGAPVVRLDGLAPGARVEFKITRGSWARVEKDDRGQERPNRVVTFDPAHPVVAVHVESWADRAVPTISRTGRIEVLDDVEMPQLGQRRRVWVFIPPGAEVATARFPVLYLFDGQNLFDRAATAFGREWQVDETIGALVREGRVAPFIVVGVENSAARGCEYNVYAVDPHPACAARTALGDKAIAFVVETLKPLIDGRYPTKPGRLDTAIGGSSMGGHLALRAGLVHPETFSRVAALSPSFQNTRAAPVTMPADIEARGALALRIHMDLGDAEQIRDLDSALLLGNLRRVRAAFRTAGYPEDEVRAIEVPGATHHEDAWAARFGEIAQWIWAKAP